MYKTHKQHRHSIHSKWNKNLNMNPKLLTLLEENIGEYWILEVKGLPKQFTLNTNIEPSFKHLITFKLRNYVHQIIP